MYACVNVFGARCGVFDCAIVFGIGCTIRECSEEVRLGIIKLSSSAARLVGRDSPERGLEVKDGAIVTVVISGA